MLERNTASQGVYVFAHIAGAAKTGDAANITAVISLDGGADAALTDTNPVEIDSTTMPGWYWFDLSAAETNAGSILIVASSTTATVEVDPVTVETTRLTTSLASDLLDAVDFLLGEKEFNFRTGKQAFKRRNGDALITMQQSGSVNLSGEEVETWEEAV